MREDLRKLLVGQEQAIDDIVPFIECYKAELVMPGRPIANILLTGPTGSGKTRTIEALAAVVLGDESKHLRVDCGEFQHSHEVAKLIGSPPGYLGHRETQPMFTQARINQWHTENLAITFLLFDELEKASDALRKIMLGILDKATLTLGDNTRVDFSKCMIFMTSNLGAKDAEGRESGYAFDRHVGAGAGRRDGVMSAAAKKLYATEFSNRIDRVIEYKPLSKESISTILDLELSKLQTLVLGRGMRAFVIEYAETAHAALIEKGFSKEYGARELKRTIFRNIQVPLAQMINEQRIPPQSRVRVTYGQDKDEFSFRVAAKRGIFT